MSSHYTWNVSRELAGALNAAALSVVPVRISAQLTSKPGSGLGTFGEKQYHYLQFGPRIAVSFHRTLRVPEDGREYPLPASLGCIPIHKIEDYSDKVPEKWRKEGGYFIPMYQMEAMFIQFGGVEWSPAIAKVSVGGVNTVTGEPLVEALSKHKQDYLVVPEQKWLDGINSGDGFVNQFVAMPLGQGYTVEAQITDEEIFGGIQIHVIESKTGRFGPPWLPPGSPPVIAPGATHSRYTWPDAPDAKRSQTEMGIAAGGRIKQSIIKDKYGKKAWDKTKTAKAVVRIVNSEVYRLITGQKAPPSPVTAENYVRAGIPWFNYPETHIPGLEKASKFQRILTIEKIARARGAKLGHFSTSKLFDFLFSRTDKTTDIPSLREVARKEYESGRWKRSLDAYTEIIQTAEDACANDFVMRAACFYQLGQFASSQRDASAALLADPKNPHAIIWHGWSSLALGFPGLALSAAEDLLKSGQYVEAAENLRNSALKGQSS